MIISFRPDIISHHLSFSLVPSRTKISLHFAGSVCPFDLV